LENRIFHNLREEETSSLKDYINLIRLHIIPILLISLTGLAVAIIYALNAIDYYKSTTAMKIHKPTGSILSSPLMPEFNDWGNDRFIANEIEILKSYRMREIVAKAFIDSFKTINEPDSFYIIYQSQFSLEDNSKQELKSVYQLISMLNGVTIEQKRGLDIVEISIESPSPYEAALLANTYANNYEMLNLKYERQQLITVKAFLETQRNEKLNDLVQSEEDLKAFQEKGGVVAIDEQARALIDVLTDFQSQRDASQIELTISEKSLQQYKDELAKQNPTIAQYIESFATEPRLRTLQESIAELETRRDLAITNTTGANRRKELISDYESRINELKSTLDEQLSVYKASIFASTPEELKQLSLKVLEEEIKSKSLQSKYESLDNIVQRYEKRFNELPRQTIDFARYQRELTAYEKLYLLVEEKYQEALINEQSTPGNVMIIDEAIRPLTPSKPNRILIVLVGLVLGVGMGLGFAFVRNYFDNTIKTPEDIQNNNMNVLAWVPQIEATQDSKEFEFIVARKPDSIHSEAFRALRTRIQFSKLQDNQAKTILVTSSAPREGKTTVAVNVAGSFAQANKRTIVIDCDLRKPRMHNVFKIQRFPGFSDYFFGQASLEEIIHHTELPNLSFITAGTIPPNPSEILGSEQMKSFLEKLKQDYDQIIIDSPPIIAVTDSEILSRLVDATILVVAANQTEIELMRKSTELLTHEENTLIGVVLNKFSYKSGYGSYYKYYYYYSQHGGNGATKNKSKVRA
jgi:capsular exopolysaccharide synthesis family protein